MQTILNDGYCPECQLKDEDVKLQLNRDDFWECPKSHLQIAVYGINAVILKFRAVGQFKTETIYGTEHINGAILTHAKDDTIFPSNTPFNSENELREYLENEVEPQLEFSLENLADSYAKFKYGNPFTYENSPTAYKRLSRHFKIDFENRNVLKKLGQRDEAESVPYSRSYKHLHGLLLSLFEKYYEADMSWLPEMGMSQIEFEFCKKHLPSSERELLKNDFTLIKQRLLSFIVDLINVVYLNKKPITNPWYELIGHIDEYNVARDFVLKKEQEVIRYFNESVSDSYRIHSEIMPSPYMGNVETAPIVLLTLNPGYDSIEEEKGFYGKYNHWIEKELIHEHINQELPLFNLDENYKDDSPYWYNKLKPLHEKFGVWAVANKVCKIQYFPYASSKFRKIPLRFLKNGTGQEYLPSQLYNFWLVEKAIGRNALIILTRSRDLWFKAVPSLKDYPNLFFTNSSQNITISHKNCPVAFPLIEKVLANKEDPVAY